MFKILLLVTLNKYLDWTKTVRTVYFRLSTVDLAY
jgi:hypothetical protein